MSKFGPADGKVAFILVKPMRSKSKGFRGLCLLRITAGQPGEGARRFHFNLPFALWLLPACRNARAVLLRLGLTMLVSTASSLKLLVNSICLASLWFFPCFQPRLAGRSWACLSVLSNRSQAQVFFTQVSIEWELDHPRLPCLIPTCSASLSLAVDVSWSVPASLFLAVTTCL